MSRSRGSYLQVRLQELLVSKRTAAELTQVEVARRLKRPQSFVSKYESGERRLDVVEFLEVCQEIGLDPAKVIRELTAVKR